MSQPHPLASCLTKLQRRKLQTILQRLGIADLPPLAFTFDTTGLEQPQDLAINCRVLSRCEGALRWESITFDWTDPSQTKDQTDWFRARVADCVRESSQRGFAYDVSIARVQTEGQEPLAAAQRVQALLHSAAEAGQLVLMHWLYRIGFLENAMRRALDIGWQMPDLAAIDLGAIEKALQLGVLPEDNEDPREFAARVHEIRAQGIPWSMAHCTDRYSLQQQIDADFAGDASRITRLSVAGRQCLLLWYLWRSYRYLAYLPEGDA